jgi:uncharacterized protein (TIGR02145 family)
MSIILQSSKSNKMKKINILCILSLSAILISFNSFLPNIREVKIGDQIWMKDNLNTALFRNGDPIFEAKTVKDLMDAKENKQPAWCYYDFDPKNGEIYGKLYNWYAVNDKRGLAPEGWHIAKSEEWDKAISFLEPRGNKIAGIKMKKENLWTPWVGVTSAVGTNKTGFSALPGGWGNYTGYNSFSQILTNGYWWTSSDYMNDRAWCYFMSYNSQTVSSTQLYHGTYLSVRCIKN